MTDETRIQDVTDDLLHALEDGEKRLEVVEGVIVEEDEDTMTYVHVLVIENLFLILRVFVNDRKLGRVHIDGVRFILHRERGRIIAARIPDLCFIQRERLPADPERAHNIEGAPTLAVEVASPGQSNAVLMGKVGDYLRYDTEEVWLVYPSRREVHQYRHDDEVPRVYRADETLTTPLFAGLALRVEDVFSTLR